MREYSLFIWSILILVNAYDDVSPVWDITSFWVITWISIGLKSLIMLVEILMFLDVIRIALLRNQVLNSYKQEVLHEENYV